ncbi:MAG: AAA family ATPase, partial [Bacilli bacterium]|nr:AAA family ATPase [Bacilli bacterium]
LNIMDEENNVLFADFKLPKGYIIFISGVPGVGKTTISYELLRRYNEIRIVEETDILREILRGYHEFLKKHFGKEMDYMFEEINIAPHNLFLSYSEAAKQCTYMKHSLEEIIKRQKRKGITTIINGVHIVPEILDGLCNNENIIYLNLFVNNEQELYIRWRERDKTKYTISNLHIAFKTNKPLADKTLKLSKKKKFLFNNIDVSNLSLEQTIVEIIKCINQQLQNSLA